MSTLPKRAQRAMFIIVGGLLGLTLFAPMVALADSDLMAGDQAVISSDGADVPVFADASYDTEQVTTVPDGTEVTIVAAAVTGVDDALWYQVTVQDMGGFIPAWALTGSANPAPDDAVETPEEPTSDEPAEPDTALIPWKEPIDFGVVVDNTDVEALPEDGLACRNDASADAAIMSRLAIGQSVEITDDMVWSGDIAFYPVNCGNQGGFVRADYVQVESGDVVSDEPADETTQEDATDVLTDEVGAETPQADATEEVDSGTGDLIVTAEDADGAPVAGVCLQLLTEDQVVAEACDTNDAFPGNGNSGFFGVEPGTYTLVSTSTDGSSDVTIVAGDEITTTVVLSPAATEEVAETPAATDEVAAETPAVTAEVLDETPSATTEVTDQAVETPESTDEVVGETPAAAEDVRVEVAETPEATDEVVGETPAAKVQVTAEVAETSDATDEVVGETPAAAEDVRVEVAETAEATNEVGAKTPAATTEVTEEVAETPEATNEVVAETPAATTEVTEEVTETPVAASAETRAAATQAPKTNQVDASQTQGRQPGEAESGADEPAPAVGNPLPDKTIGSAEVQGTNGDGVRCRVAADAGSTTISVLPEGTKVSVYAQEGRFLAINCGGQLGYASVEYLWSGGAGDDIASSVSTVTVAGTGGGGLNCRTGASMSASIIGQVAEGSVLGTRGGSSSGWLPVVCNGEAGYVSIDYVNAGGAAGVGGNDFSSAAAVKGWTTVSGTNGDGVRCRSRASTSGNVLAVIPEGTRVGTRGGSNGGWTPIRCYGYDGYASSEYLSGSGGSSDGGSGSGVSSGSVKVTGTGGGGLRCRSGAGTSAGIITVLSEGSVVKVRGAASNGWQPVTCAGKSGYVSTDYISASSGGGSSDSGGSDSNSSVVSWGVISGTNGDGVRCRTSGSTSGNVISVIPEGTRVGLRGSARSGWTPVRCYGNNGYVSSEYLKASSGSAPEQAPPSGGGSLAKNDHAKLTSNVNLRYEPSMTAGIATVVPTGTVVQVTGGPTSGFYKVSWDGLNGYLHGDYLSKTNGALSERGGSGNPAPAPETPSGGGGSATGNAVADYAMRYVGYPYVWATHGPSSFDCSGFTYWVAKNVLGVDIGTGTWTQSVAGKAVSKANLQPGDLVFFQNTYAAGLSHVGIYIGGGQFVHAENESTGVKVSDLNSSYYGSRWYGAVRLT